MSREMETLITLVKGGVEDIREMFNAPEDDWMPTAFTVDAEDRLVLMAIDPGFLATPAGKELLTGVVLPEMVAKQSAVAAAFVCSAWSVEYPKGGDAEPSPKDHPDRKEVVQVTAATAFEIKSLWTPIVRHRHSPPTLGEWTEGGDDIEGTFPTALRQGLVRQG